MQSDDPLLLYEYSVLMPVSRSILLGSGGCKAQGSLLGICLPLCFEEAAQLFEDVLILGHPSSTRQHQKQPPWHRNKQRL